MNFRIFFVFLKNINTSESNFMKTLDPSKRHYLTDMHGARIIGWINFRMISQPSYIVETLYRTGDTIPDGRDNCPDKANSGHEDVESDGIGDGCDNDTIYGTVTGDVYEGIFGQNITYITSTFKLLLM